jgi:hypothetical protein
MNGWLCCGLRKYGLRWVQPELPLAHPFPDGSAATLATSVTDTAGSLDRDADRYRRLIGPFVGRWSELSGDVLRPLFGSRPVHPALLARLGVRAAAPAYLLDTSPAQLAALAGSRLPPRYAARLHRYRHGPAVFKIDYALAGSVPWTAQACRRAGTIHLAPSYATIDAALRAVYAGGAPDPPFLIAAQPNLWDSSRAPAGSHVFWVYAHVPNGWPGDRTPAVESQLERSHPASRTWCWPAPWQDRARCSGATRTTSAATSPAAAATACDCCCAPPSRRSSMPRRTHPCSCARRRHRPAPAYTACAATTRPASHFAGSSTSGSIHQGLTSGRPDGAWTGSPHPTTGGAD